METTNGPMKRNLEVFTSAEDDKLIKLVSQYPFLYDTTTPLFRNAFKRLKAWDEIGAQLNKSGKGCKSRWRNIKDTYFRQKKKVNTGQAVGGHPRSKYEDYQKKLAFLEEIIPLKISNRSSFNITVSNNDENSHSANESEAEQSEEIIFLKEECDSDDNVSAIPIEDPNTDTEQWDYAGYKSSTETIENQDKSDFTKKRMMMARKRQLMKLKNRKKLEARQKLKMKRAEEDDEINLFTRQANSVLRKLPSYHQIKAMQEMFEILTKYKILASESATASTSNESYGINSNSDPLMDS